MKIKYLEAHKYLQFKDFKLDLTYPEGHDKAGQPLEKVCFIGQSGTGKTSLLNLIRAVVSYDLIATNYATPAMENIWGQTFNSDDETHKNFSIKNGEVQWEIKKKAKVNFTRMKGKKLKDFLTEYYQDSNVLVSFPAEMNTNLKSIFSTAGVKGGLVTKESNQEELDAKEAQNTSKLRFFDFERDNIEAVWNLILDDIQKYKVAQLSYTNELSNRLNNNAFEASTLLKDFVAWKRDHPNPLKELADRLNPMLNRFNLEIKPEFDFKTADDLRFIQIHQKNGHSAIPNSGWSTGTKQLIMTATPLLKLNTDKAVILIDEPERSFYPDIQLDLMGFYKHLAPNAQFFVATHSPIIAASFDPWEIVELKFNEEGNIIQDLYFDGERHVDNYRVHPKYLRWDAVLTQLFDLEQDGMPERQAKLQELAELDVRLQKMKKANGSANPEEVKALWENFKQTAELLDWKIQDYHEKN
jgi:energy-coupling factor transporter ATP-binding protein EcfA2